MLFLKKTIRDLTKNKSRSLPIIVLILISQTASILYIEIGVLMDASWDQYFQEGQVGDVWIDTLPLSSTHFNESVVANWQSKYSISAVQPRLFFTGEITLGQEKIPVEIVSLPGNNSNSLNKILTNDGSYFTDHSLLNGVYIEQSYLEMHHIEVGSELKFTIDLGIESKSLNATILGGAHSPEYPMKAGEGASQQQFEFSASFAQYLTMSIFVQTEFLQKELFQDQEIYNQICVSLGDKDDLDSFILYLQTDESPLNKYTINVRKYPALIEDMAFLMIAVGFGVAVFFLFISMFLTYTVVNRFIDEQKPQIGVMKSLGYSNRYILTRNLFYGLILGFIGSFLGNIIGGVLGIVFANIAINSWLSLPYLVLILPIKEFFMQLGLTLLISTLACYISARRVLKISPRAAIQPTVQERKITTFIVEDIFQKWVFRLSAPVKYAIRNVFVNPKRTMTTIFSLLLAVALVGGVLTIISSVAEGSSLMFESEKWDAQIPLTNSEPFTEIESSLLAKLSSPESLILEPQLQDYIKIKESTSNTSIWTKLTFTALQPNQILKALPESFETNTSVIVSADLAKSLQLEIGYQYLVLGRNGTQTTIAIQYILPQQYIAAFFIPFSLGNYLSYGNASNQLVNTILLAGLSSEDDIGVLRADYSLILKSDLIQQAESWYTLISSIISGILFLILIIAGMIIYSIMSIDIAERKDDLVIMRALGIQNRNIHFWGLLEVFIYTALASIGYFVGFAIAAWYMDILQQLMQQPQGTFKLSVVHYLFSMCFGLFAAVLGQFFALRYVLKQKIALVTKEKMFG